MLPLGILSKQYGSTPAEIHSSARTYLQIKVWNLHMRHLLSMKRCTNMACVSWTKPEGRARTPLMVVCKQVIRGAAIFLHARDARHRNSARALDITRASRTEQVGLPARTGEIRRRCKRPHSAVLLNSSGRTPPRASCARRPNRNNTCCRLFARPPNWLAPVTPPPRNQAGKGRTQ